MEINELLKLATAGGNIAMLISVYFIMKASERLARIEKALSLYMEETTQRMRTINRNHHE